MYGDRSALSPGGVRVGTPALTTRGLKEEEFRQVCLIPLPPSVPHSSLSLDHPSLPPSLPPSLYVSLAIHSSHVSFSHA